MIKLTDLQKEYIKDLFFKNEKYAGWANIAEALLTYGKCTAVGDGSIWIGGVGNFITTSKNDLYVGCVDYFFDDVSFFNSLFFKEVYSLHIKDVDIKIKEMERKISELKSLQNINLQENEATVGKKS